MKSHKVSAKPTVSIIGFGRLGSAFAVALRAAGYPIQAVTSKRKVNTTRAIALLGKQTLALSSTQLDKLPSSDITLITTPDDAIAEVARTLSEIAPGKKGATVFHASGALSSEALAPLTKVGYHTGSIHPLVAVSSALHGEKVLRGAFFCVEADRTAKKIAQAIVNDLHGESFSINPNKKALYHAAAVMSSGHLVALLDLAQNMLMHCGLNARDARRVLAPLINSTIRNLEDSTAGDALTGTFARGDIETVARHLEALENEDLYMAFETYRLLGTHSLEIAKHNSHVAESVEEIKKLLYRVDK